MGSFSYVYCFTPYELWAYTELINNLIRVLKPGTTTVFIRKGEHTYICCGGCGRSKSEWLEEVIAKVGYPLEIYIDLGDKI